MARALYNNLGNRIFGALMGAIFIGTWGTIAVHATYKHLTLEPWQKAAAAQRRHAEELADRTEREINDWYVKRWEARWQPIIDRNVADRSFHMEACKDAGLMIPDGGRYRHFLVKCMADKGYQFDLGEWFAAWETFYDRDGVVYSFDDARYAERARPPVLVEDKPQLASEPTADGIRDRAVRAAQAAAEAVREAQQ